MAGGPAPEPPPEPPAADDEAVVAAREWVRAVMDDRDLARAWPLTDPALRMVLVQHWVLGAPPDVVGPEEGWDALAAGLAGVPPAHPLWRRFASERLGRWREYWPGFSAVTWGVRARRDIGPDLTVVTFVEPRGKLMSLRPGPPLEFRWLALRRVDGGWLMAGLDGRNLFKPGWPPQPA